MNRVSLHRRSLRNLLLIGSHNDYHDYMFGHALDLYRTLCQKQDRTLGAALAVCADWKEARAFGKYDFDQVLLTGIMQPDVRLLEILKTTPGMSYERQNCEHVCLPSGSWDLVFCKAGLHHLARPVLGLYEMLRVCRRAVIIQEPFNSALGRMFRRLNLNSVYESHGEGNRDGRCNHVYRWSSRELRSLLNSYYLESGYTLDLTLGWTSTKFNAHPSKMVRRLAAVGGWAVSLLPGCRGNGVTALILPGSDVPPDAVPANEFAAV